jgi:predicted DNA-binding transcriptional regulator YafY
VSNPVPRLRRLLAIIPLLQRRGGISKQELQETLAISKRELEGDLYAILLCGVPPYLPSDYIGIDFESDWVTVAPAPHFARPARLTLREALALRLAIERLPLPEDGPLADAAIELLDTLDRLMPKQPRSQGKMADLEGRIEAPKAQDVGDKLSVIDAAVASRTALELTYYSASSEQVSRGRRVRPYARGDAFGNQYLIGFDEKSQELRSFRLDRISRLGPVGDAGAFEVPKDFDLGDALESIAAPKPKQVRLRFKEQIARFAAEDHAEARVEQAEGGDVTVELSCGSIPWAVSKALHYGELAEIEAPPEARQAMVERLRDFLRE